MRGAPTPVIAKPVRTLAVGPALQGTIRSSRPVVADAFKNQTWFPPEVPFLCSDKEMGERKRLRRGRFRILPLLRTTPIETAQEGAPLRRFPLLENPLQGERDQVSAPPSRRGENGDKITTLWLPLFRPASHFCQAGGRFYRRGSPPPESFQGDSQGGIRNPP